MLRRRVVEDRLLHAIHKELFTAEAVAYITQRVNEGLRAQARERQRVVADREHLEEALQKAMTELDNIRDAIRQGLTADLTRQMLEEAESHVRQLQAQLETPPKASLHVLQVLPRIVAERLENLERVLAQDVTIAREALREILNEIRLQPTTDGLVAELQGDLRGLLALGEQTPMLETLVAGARYSNYQ